MSVYLDASVVVSMFVRDAFSDLALERSNAGPDAPVVSDWAVAEAVSAIMGFIRTQALTPVAAKDVIARLDAWAAVEADRVEVAPSDIRAADHMLREPGLGLRTPDALHLAIARRLELPLLTFDVPMSRDARALGLVVIDS